MAGLTFHPFRPPAALGRHALDGHGAYHPVIPVGELTYWIIAIKIPGNPVLGDRGSAIGGGSKEEHAQRSKNSAK